jgi:hypothetical protein
MTLVLTLTLIGLIEYACQVILVDAGVGKLGDVMNNTLNIDIPSDLSKRQIESCMWISYNLNSLLPIALSCCGYFLIISSAIYEPLTYLVILTTEPPSPTEWASFTIT